LCDIHCWEFQSVDIVKTSMGKMKKSGTKMKKGLMCSVDGAEMGET